MRNANQLTASNMIRTLILTQFWSMFLFCTHWKHQKTNGFLLFSEDIKWEHWSEIVKLVNFSSFPPPPHPAHPTSPPKKMGKHSNNSLALWLALKELITFYFLDLGYSWESKFVGNIRRVFQWYKAWFKDFTGGLGDSFLFGKVSNVRSR